MKKEGQKRFLDIFYESKHLFLDNLLIDKIYQGDIHCDKRNALNPNPPKSPILILKWSGK